MRLDHTDTRLLVVDEPTASLDPAAEAHIFSEILRRRKGKTVVILSQRIGSLVRQADLIL